MLVRTYVVHDLKAEAFLSPFVAVNDGVAMRMLQTSMSAPNSLFSSHAGDFQLVCVGEYDDKTGQLCPQDHRIICSLHELKESV